MFAPPSRLSDSQDVNCVSLIQNRQSFILHTNVRYLRVPFFMCVSRQAVFSGNAIRSSFVLRNGLSIDTGCEHYKLVVGDEALLHTEIIFTRLETCRRSRRHCNSPSLNGN